MKLDKISIRWQICCGFVAFAAFMLVLLWLFQIVFLDSFYRSIKTSKVESCTQAIVSNLDSRDRDGLIQEISDQNDLSVRIISLKSFEDLYKPEVIPDIFLYNRIGFVEIYDYYLRAQEQGGALLETNDFDQDRDSLPQGVIDKYGTFIPLEKSNNTSILSVRLESLKDSTPVMVMVYSVISPVNSTVEALQLQLMIITAILLAVAVVLSILLSRLVSKPIVVTTESAKHLAKGEYDIEFEASGYKEVVELNQTLSYAATELSKVEELRRDLIANISHDLRTPLTMITGYGEMMRDIPGENTPDNVQIIIDEAKRLSSLVTDLLDLSKLQSGTQSLTLSEFNLTDSVRAIMTRYSMLTSQDGYHINFYSDHDVLIQADEIKISQVIYNLINNAINYVGEDKTVEVTQRSIPGGVRLEVTDHGKGIAPEDLPYIWDRYYKVDKTHKRAVIGTGLGLSIVKSVLDMHHARYGVQSQLGQGSTFWFELENKPSETVEALPPG